MKYLVLIRHGESQLNVVNKEKRVFCGQIDTHLTDFGREQAIHAGKRLAELDFLRIQRAISSPLTRAYETLSLVLGQLSELQVSQLPHSPELMERSHGHFEGLSDDEAFVDYPQYRDHPDFCHFMNHYDQCAPGGETLRVVAERAWPIITCLMEQEGDLLVVSHYNTIRCIIGKALQLAPEEVVQLRIPNAVPIVLRHRSGYELVDAPDLGYDKLRRPLGLAS